MAKHKLTEERKDTILQAIRAGNTKETAAALAGISEATLYNWLAKGRDEEAPDLEGKTVKELRTLAKQHNIKGASKMNTAQLQAAILKASNIFADFLAEMNLAEASGMATHVQNITTAGLEDWRASAWYLERRDPANWAKRDRLQADINHTGNIKTEHEETYKIHIEQKLAEDPELQDLYIKIWERQSLEFSDE